MNILVTGANGFIGRHLAPRLRELGNVLTPRSFELNLLDENSVTRYLAEHPADYIVHLAAAGVRVSSDSPEQVAEDNVRMFDNLVMHRPSDCPVIVLGSGAEYDKRQAIRRVPESAWKEACPTDPYGRSKHEISRRIELLDNVSNLRVFGVFGPGEHPTRLPAYVLNCCRHNEDISLNQNVLFDYVYIDDLCDIITLFIKRNIHEKFVNITPDKSIYLGDMAHIIIENFQTYTGTITFCNTGLGLEYTGDNSLFHSIIHDFKFMDYESSIKNYIKESISI